MQTPEYVRNAQNKYNSQFDLIQLKLPKGTKERIRAIIGEDGKIAPYCASILLDALDGKNESIHKSAPDAPKTTSKSAANETPEDDLNAVYERIWEEYDIRPLGNFTMQLQLGNQYHEKIVRGYLEYAKIRNSQELRSTVTENTEIEGDLAK